MSAIDEKVKAVVSKSKGIEGNCLVALEELVKLQEYYKNEVKQRKNEIKKFIKDDKRYDYEQGKLLAYGDHITEIGSIIEIMTGR